ncbi:MAG: MFS transporter [Prevotella sp.]|nr:MFS transporter [Prevotella sp.]
MYTQNTKVHVRLWHHDFWRLAFANLLLTMSVYMLIPFLPQWMRMDNMSTAVVMGSYGIGLFALGGFCNYLVQRYRRNMVCVWSVAFLALTVGALYLLDIHPELKNPYVLTALRVAMGAAFALAQMVLASTLVIDTTESFMRTEANHSIGWFGRLAIALGPLAAWGIEALFGKSFVIVGSAACCAVAIVLILLVDIPFKAPEEDVSKISCDRFFLRHGLCLFLNLMLVAMAVGIILTSHTDPVFFGMMLAGFFLALFTQQLVFENAELKSEIITGLLLLGAAQLMLFSGQYVPTTFIAPAFIGLGTGIVGARFLMFFVKLSDHCQRGTSQSTYILAWESGVAAGLFVGYAIPVSPQEMTWISILFIVAAFLMYHLFTHSWYLNHKNR